uniref:Uncharacterized protein n=1 Tax=Candidatus Kentrum eta TaxID=2126337 RepID=A0A450VDS6_9GAMM|nr:MAG: hypothetical protein BECKH772A_GA0070896_100939 [Candidatus Kentron sp. H]VFJ97718.1 MAG: hypothetical protein BECKH772B_GA0070898_101179 [Candidatus Kentron sp. H]VFK02953.1 MAG: hypothetical protein BECKH772C_GA0070978_101099 [Candidatus Kentron sp. H]
MLNLLDKAVIEAKTLPESAQNAIGSVLLSDIRKEGGEYGRNWDERVSSPEQRPSRDAIAISGTGRRQGDETASPLPTFSEHPFAMPKDDGDFERAELTPREPDS